VTSGKTIHPLLTAVAVCAVATATGALLATLSSGNGNGTQTGSVYILGPARSLLSNNLYTRADIYFHKGAPRHKEEAFHSFFHKWKDAICPAEHAHREGNETVEIMPWLRLATQSDPHNIEAYLVASYWLNSDCGRPDLALEAIREAIEKNPGRYELHLELGRIHLSTDDYESALTELQHARALIAKPYQADPEQAAIDHPFILMAQSYLFEALDQRKNAIESTEQFLLIRSSRHFSERLEKLQSNPLDPGAARNRLHELFHKSLECEEDHGDHDHDEHCDHD